MSVEYGLQMYSLRDITGNDLGYALKKTAEMGYKYVEYAGFFGHPAERVAAWQDEYGLICSGTHSSWQDLLPDRLGETVKYHKAIGNKHFIVPGADLSTLDKIIDFCDVINAAQPVLEDAGISLGYHNHSREFVVMPWGSTIHSELERRTRVDFEIDTFWAFHAGVDPILLLDRLADRIGVIHIKDGMRDGSGRSLGLGETPVLEVRKKAIQMGLLMVVESEGCDPTGLDEVKRCIDFLREQEK